MSRRSATVFRYIAYALEIIVIHILNATPRLLPEIFGAKPALLICVAVTVAVFEREIPAMVFGAVCGVLLDLGCSGSIGIFAVVLTLLCFLIGFLANNVIVASFVNFLICSFIVTGAVFMIYFTITYVWENHAEPWLYFQKHMISRMAQTFVFSIPFYFVNRFVYQTLEDN